MHLPTRDIIATGLVAAASLLYLLCAIGSTLPGMSSTRATGVAVLALGSRPSPARWCPPSASCSTTTRLTWPSHH
jgi:hypothetical protein